MRTTYPATMLRDFIAANRGDILAQAHARVALRGTPGALDPDAVHGFPVFLDQLGDALRRVSLNEVFDRAEIHDSAGHHGDYLFGQGLTVGQVISGYGDLCQIITGLAVTQRMNISAGEFQTLNLCLDEATSGAVISFSAKRERSISDEGTERLGVLAHEMRNALNTAVLSFGAIKTGAVAPAGSTSAMLERSHMRLQALIDRSLADVRLDAGLMNPARVSVSEMFEEAEIGAAMIALARRQNLSVSSVDITAFVEADRSILAAVIANLLHNALKFSSPGTTIILRARTTTHRVLIDVEDECGGLPPGATEELLEAFTQKGADRTGLGLGLSICLKGVKMMGGELHIRDLPGKGCMFTIDLPKRPPPPDPVQ